MKTRPILFNGEMVRAILDGRKTQTRRVVKPQPFEGPDKGEFFWVPRRMFGHYILPKDAHEACPYGRPGDQLWVRETWARGVGVQNKVFYRVPGASKPGYAHWKPSIHMKRVDSRITLEITDVRVERVQEISEKDAKAEGVGQCKDPDDPDDGPADYFSPLSYGQGFENLWDSVNLRNLNKPGATKYLWDKNPWVWVIEFKALPNS